ncbi:MAG: hypothetical protein HOP11_08595 [Saprospiraceae bacterium]|nr:hypothetical protein [Saprospiraceae bacterium]
MIQKSFDPTRSAMSSQEKRIRGVILIEYVDPKDPNSKRTKSFQDPSWTICGYAGSITTGRNGNVYVLPKANVNMLYNQPQNQNTIYVVDSESGKMTQWLSIPMARIPDNQNANGLLSAYYDCDNDNLIVCSIAGSNQKTEIGKVYTINTTTKNINTILENRDVLSVVTARIGNQKKLFYGLCRKSEIWSIDLDNNNIPIGKPNLEINISDLGPRGDDKARKIRIDQNGFLQIHGVPFFYNLTAPVNRQESIYTYQYNALNKKWILREII